MLLGEMKMANEFERMKFTKNRLKKSIKKI